VNPIDYSFGQRLQDVSPAQRTADTIADFVAALDVGRSAVKLKSGYICGPMRGRRCARNALPRTWLPLDADKISPQALGAWADFCRQHRAIRWPTHSSTPDAPRQRVIVFLDKPATRDECVSTGEALRRAVRAKFGDDVELDSSVFRPEQPVLLPPEGAEVEGFDGAVLPVLAGQPAPTRRAEGADNIHPQSSSVILSNPLSSSVGFACSSVGAFARAAVGDFPPDCVPEAEGQRNGRLFELARHLKADNPEAEFAQVREVAKSWHATFVDIIGTKSLLATIDTLWQAYQKVKHPKGALMIEALQAADSLVIPPLVDRLGYSEQERALLRVCIALATHHAPEPFFLSARTAGGVVKMDYSDAAKALRVMALDGLLEVVHKGSGRTASRYRLGPALTGAMA
jgi:hypothetical protein